MTRRGDGIEIHDDFGVQLREWRTERVAFVVIAALLVAALLGLFGTGPLAWATVANDAGTLTVEYERFARRGGTSAFTVVVSERSQSDGEFQLLFDRTYLEAFTIEAITPEPTEVGVAEERLRYTFAQAHPGASLTVTFHVTPQSLGRVPASVSLRDQKPLRYWHFFYP